RSSDLPSLDLAAKAAYAEPRAVRPRLGLVLERFLDLGDRSIREEIPTQIAVEHGVAAPQPLEDHRGVFLLLVAIVREHGLEVCLVVCVGSLSAPSYGVEG